MNRRRKRIEKLDFRLNRVRDRLTRRRESAPGGDGYTLRGSILVQRNSTAAFRCWWKLPSFHFTGRQPPGAEGRSRLKYGDAKVTTAQEQPTTFPDFVSPEAHPRAVFRRASLPDFAGLQSNGALSAPRGAHRARNYFRAVKRITANDFIRHRRLNHGAKRRYQDIIKSFLNDTSDIYGYPIPSIPSVCSKLIGEQRFGESVHLAILHVRISYCFIYYRTNTIASHIYYDATSIYIYISFKVPICGAALEFIAQLSRMWEISRKNIAK